MFLFAIAGTGISAYAIMNYNGDRFGDVMITYAVVMFCFESISQALSVSFENPLLGMLGFMNFWFGSFLFSGMFITIEDIVWPFQVFAYILPLRYGIQTMVYHEFIAVDFKGAALCTPGSSATCLSHSGDTGTNEGWACSDGSTDERGCVGKSGWQILDTMHNSFDVVESDIDSLINLVIILAIAVVAKICYVLLMAKKANAITQITAAAGPA
mmetsp:Transcript_27081/g.45361  ORF Transcript_27081/g.45361 Transcript_27081/m.45361 type:complete len:213 (+) Transcript_27081:3-641(+)